MLKAVQSEPLSSEDSPVSEEQAKFALERTLILLGSYSRARPHDPETYTDAIAATLAGYPREIIQHVTDPRTGFQRTSKWLPEVAEIVEVCEAEIARRAREKQLAQISRPKPKLIEAPRDPARDAEMAARFKALLSTLSSNMKINRTGDAEPPAGMSREQWAKIPDAQ